MAPMLTRLTLAVVCASACLLNSIASAQTPAAVLAPTGTLRAVFLGGNPVQGRIDPQTGKAAGPVADIVEALAKKIGVPYVIVGAPNILSMTT